MSSGGSGSGRAVRDDDPYEEPIDQADDMAMDHLFRHDRVITKTKRLAATEVWRNAWLVRWGGKAVMRYFDTPIVRRALRDLLMEMRDQERYRHYVGIYFVKDMKRWAEEFRRSMEILGHVPSTEIVLPCGIITPDMGQYFLVSPRGRFSATRILTFRPNDDRLNETYSFRVFNRSARFYPSDMDRSNESSSGPRFGSYAWLVQAMQRTLPGAGAGRSLTGTLRPYSEFREIFEQRRDLHEAKTYNYNAGFAIANPSSFLTAVSLPSAPADEVPDSVLAEARDLGEARAKTGARTALGQQKFTLQRGIQIVESLRRTMSSVTGRDIPIDSVVSGMGFATGGEGSIDGLSDRQRLAAEYGRLDPAANLVPIPDFVQVAPGSTPALPFDMAQERLAYEVGVCREMDIPHSLYRTEIDTGRASGESNISLSESIIAKMVESEISIYQELFDQLYMTVWGPMDDALFEDLAAEAEEMPDEDYVSEKSQSVIQWLMAMKARSESYAKLEFEMLTAHSLEHLKAMIEAQQMGLVSRHLVERNASRLFGYTIGHHPSKYALRSDATLRTNFNPPILAPVSAETDAKIESDERRDKMKAKAAEAAAKAKAAAAPTPSPSGEPARKKQKTSQ